MLEKLIVSFSSLSEVGPWLHVDWKNSVKKTNDHLKQTRTL